MLNTLRIAPLNIAPYAANRVGLMPYAGYDTYFSETIEAPKAQRPANRPAVSKLNTTLKTDTFTARNTINNQVPNTTAKTAKGVDATTYNRLTPSANVALKSELPKARQALNFLA
jgi:hypothetical protein